MANKKTNITEAERKTNIAEVEKESYVRFPLVRINFIMMGIAATAIVVGFLLMLGGSSTTTEFNPDIYSTRRIVIGPAISFLGFLFMGYGIIYRPKKEKKDELD